MWGGGGGIVVLGAMKCELCIVNPLFHIKSLLEVGKERSELVKLGQASDSNIQINSVELVPFALNHTNSMRTIT